MTLEPTSSTTSPPTTSPTSSTTTTFAPSPQPTFEPTSDDKSVPDHCLLLETGTISAIKPIASNQLFSQHCITALNDGANVLRVEANFLKSVPSPKYQTMLVSNVPFTENEIMNQTTGLLRECRNICVGISNCECIDGEERTMTKMNKLYWTLNNKVNYNKPSYFALFDDVVDNTDVHQFSLFDDSIQNSTVIPMTDFELEPNMIHDSLLSNLEYDGAKTTGNVEKIQLTLPLQEEDALLQFTATPLLFGNETTKVMQTKTCLLDDDISCHVWLNPKYDYNVRVQNNGKHTNRIQLYSQTFDQRNYNGLNRTSDGSTDTAIKYIIGGVFFVFIWILVLMVISRLTKAKRGKAKKRKNNIPFLNY